TEFLYANRPSVLDEVDRGLSTLARVADVVPGAYLALRQALARYFPASGIELGAVLRFGTWMGGDRDGNPAVTWEVTAATLTKLRRAAVEMHLEWCRRLYGYLTMACHRANRSDVLSERVREALVRWPAATNFVTRTDSAEPYRRWLRVVEWRLLRTLEDRLDLPPVDGAYRDGRELEADLDGLRAGLSQEEDPHPLSQEVQRWHDLTRCFGLHLASLDIRQDSRVYREVMTEVLVAAGITTAQDDSHELVRREVLSRTLGFDGHLDADRLTPIARDTLRLYELVHRAVVRWGADCLGGSIVSLTSAPSDVLSVLWLWRRAWGVAQGKGEPTADRDLHIVPLFEKIDDLHRAPQTFRAILAEPAYAEYLTGQQRRQWIMIGYSDSTKDGGYVAANWGLYQAQAALHRVASEHGLHVTFFHGRGGSLGRGGGPAARGILSLPPESLQGALRLTEQGEVLSERYDDPEIASRHLEQVTWAVLRSASRRVKPPTAAWLSKMEILAKTSRDAYRALVDQPGFIQYFSATTPLEVIEDLPIASRPARRTGGRTLDDLRAIPWVFAWTQNRCLIPAWYGLGTALETSRGESPRNWETLRTMYQDWSFFRAMIDNACLALAKADMFVAEQYARLEGESGIREPIWSRILSEFQRTRQQVLDLVGGEELLAEIPWFQRSIEVRNPYVDPLNLIQIEFLRRQRDDSRGHAETPAMQSLRDLLRLTVQGVASGMRTTG
ncbi:MAG TPA: phosphoenolpyruvate carboxylase, partial [Pirellulaceae bacterium]